MTPSERPAPPPVRWSELDLYRRFEHAIVLILTVVIAIIVVAAMWSLILKVVVSLLETRTFDPTEHVVFQSVFGMIFTVIIALEFKRTLTILAERENGVVQVRAVILIALLAVVRKLLILDLGADVPQLFALATAVLALGTVYWLVR